MAYRELVECFIIELIGIGWLVLLTLGTSYLLCFVLRFVSCADVRGLFFRACHHTFYVRRDIFKELGYQ